MTHDVGDVIVINGDQYMIVSINVPLKYYEVFRNGDTFWVSENDIEMYDADF